SAFLLLALGVAAGLGRGLAMGDSNHLLPRALGMSLSKIPAVWAMAGIAALVYGLLPRAASFVIWSILGLFVLVEMLWEAQLVGWQVLQLTPFAYAHYTIPSSELPLLPLFGLI